MQGNGNYYQIMEKTVIELAKAVAYAISNIFFANNGLISFPMSMFSDLIKKMGVY